MDCIRAVRWSCLVVMSAAVVAAFGKPASDAVKLGATQLPSEVAGDVPNRLRGGEPIRFGGTACSDTCPAAPFGTIPFAEVGDGFIIGTFDTCPNTNAFEEDNSGSCGDGAYGSGARDLIFSFNTLVTGIYSWDTCFFPAG